MHRSNKNSPFNPEDEFDGDFHQGENAPYRGDKFRLDDKWTGRDHMPLLDLSDLPGNASQIPNLIPAENGKNRNENPVFATIHAAEKTVVMTLLLDRQQNKMGSLLEDAIQDLNKSYQAAKSGKEDAAVVNAMTTKFVVDVNSLLNVKIEAARTAEAQRNTRTY